MTETEVGLDLVGDSLGLALHNLVNRHLQDMSVCGKGKLYSGYLESEEDYVLFVDDLKALGVSFSTENSKIYKHSRILFTSEMRNSEFKIPYFGSPFQIIKSSYLLCSQGGNYRPQLIDPLSPDHPPKKRRFSLQPTKKIGCKALMMVKCIRIFDDECYKSKSPTYKDCSYENRTIMAKLNKDLLSASPPAGTLRFMVVMSTADEHNHTVVSTNLNQILHPRLREEIYRCAEGNNVCSVETMRTHLGEFVRCMFEGEDRPQPDSLNRCYYPNDTSIRFHMRQAGFTIVRGKRRTKHSNKSLVQSAVPAEADANVDPGRNEVEQLQVEPSVFRLGLQSIKREKTALEQCIILRRATAVDDRPTFEMDGDELQIEPGVFTVESAKPEETDSEGCIILHRATPDGDDGGGEDTLEFYAEEEVVTNAQDEEEESADLRGQVDVKKLCDETRDNLKMMVRYTYLLRSPESAIEIAHLTQQLKDKMLSSVLRTNEGLLLVPSELNIHPQMKKRNLVDSIKKKYSNLPQRSKLRNTGKYVD